MARIPARALDEATRRLTGAGCVAAHEEAEELAAAAQGDPGVLEGYVERRVSGEPLAWITGSVRFCGCVVSVRPGVFVPRWQSEPLAERAAALLPAAGRAVDLGTGSGAIARILMDRRPRASVLGTEVDPAAMACARGNGVTVVEGDLFTGVPPAWRGTADVVVGVLPYVPTDALEYLPRDVRDVEPLLRLDGGPDGLEVVRAGVAQAARWLRPGGRLLLELGGDQPRAIAADLESAGLELLEVLHDDDGDPRGIDAVARPPEARPPGTPD